MIKIEAQQRLLQAEDAGDAGTVVMHLEKALGKGKKNGKDTVDFKKKGQDFSVSARVRLNADYDPAALEVDVYVDCATKIVHPDRLPFEQAYHESVSGGAQIVREIEAEYKTSLVAVDKLIKELEHDLALLKSVREVVDKLAGK